MRPTYESRKGQSREYAYNAPYLEPQLVCAGKAKHTSFEVNMAPSVW
jgi:hypothetical protein